MLSPSEIYRAADGTPAPIDEARGDADMINIAVEGCCHGELDVIYETIAALEKRSGKRVHLLLICGDFQSMRDSSDLGSLNVPSKYKKLNRYYSLTYASTDLIS